MGALEPNPVFWAPFAFSMSVLIEGGLGFRMLGCSVSLGGAGTRGGGPRGGGPSGREIGRGGGGSGMCVKRVGLSCSTLVGGPRGGEGGPRGGCGRGLDAEVTADGGGKGM